VLRSGQNETQDRGSDGRASLADSLMQLKGWDGLTVDVLLAPFDTDLNARQGQHDLFKAACYNASDPGVVVVCGWVTHLREELPVAGIICPVLASEDNKRWLLATSMIGLREAIGLIKLGDQSVSQLGSSSSPLFVVSFTGHVTKMLKAKET
jgi:hypothetical protein